MPDENPTLCNKLEGLIHSLANAANASDADHTNLQDALLIARKMDAESRDWTADRFTLSCGYADARSLRDRFKRLAGFYGEKSRESGKTDEGGERIELAELLRRVLEQPGQGWVERLVLEFGQGQVVSLGAILDKLNIPVRFADALLRDAQNQGVLKRIGASNNYEVHHQGVIRRNLRSGLGPGPLGGISGSADTI